MAIVEMCNFFQLDSYSNDASTVIAICRPSTLILSYQLSYLRYLCSYSRGEEEWKEDIRPPNIKIYDTTYSILCSTYYILRSMYSMKYVLQSIYSVTTRLQPLWCRIGDCLAKPIRGFEQLMLKCQIFGRRQRYI